MIKTTIVISKSVPIIFLCKKSFPITPKTIKIIYNNNTPSLIGLILPR